MLSKKMNKKLAKDMKKIYKICSVTVVKSQIFFF